MIEVKFYDDVDDSLLDYAVVAARYRGKWGFCKHGERDTYECPGGHREKGEDAFTTRNCHNSIAYFTADSLLAQNRNTLPLPFKVAQRDIDDKDHGDEAGEAADDV
jgi:8-oxo-dGTP diphosphatase